MATKTLRGKIIRLLDRRTVIVNLGQIHGVEEGCEFRILGQLEAVVDPESGVELGKVNVVKCRIWAIQVFEKFTIAGTKHTIWTSTIAQSLLR